MEPICGSIPLQFLEWPHGAGTKSESIPRNSHVQICEISIQFMLLVLFEEFLIELTL